MIFTNTKSGSKTQKGSLNNANLAHSYVRVKKRRKFRDVSLNGIVFEFICGFGRG